MGTPPPTGAGVLRAYRPRITRDDFPPPPEFAGRDPDAAPSSHVGGLRAELLLRDGRMALGRTYQQNPLRAARPVDDGPGTPGLLYLMNSTAGLLDGDGQWVDLDVGPGVRGFVTNQSAGRVHPCPLGHAAARFDLHLAPGAVLCALPGPTIPFAGSRFHQRTTLRLEPGAAVVWGDILLPGRTHYARAPERFRVDRIVQELRVERGGTLVHHERLAWQGPWDEDEIRWHFADAEAAAALFISGDVPDSLLPAADGLAVAPQATAAGDTCVRLLGRDPERLIAATARLALTAAARLAGDPAPWFIDGTALAASHWFSPIPHAGPAEGRPESGGHP